MSKELAELLRGVEIPVDRGVEQQRIMNALFNGLNKKLEPIGLSIKHATLGFNSKVDVQSVFAKLKAAKLV